jgi:hypothetical protein
MALLWHTGTAMVDLTKRDKQTIIILGCQHIFQLVENELNPAFRQLVEGIIEQDGVSFIGEEAEQGRRTIAQEIAAARDLKYLNIDIPRCVQDQIQLPPYTRYNQTTGLVEVVVGSDKYVVSWTLVREYHMYKTFVGALTSAEPSLLICGRSHVAGFVELLDDRYRVISISFATTVNAGSATAS